MLPSLWTKNKLDYRWQTEGEEPTTKEALEQTNLQAELTPGV